MNFDFKNYSYEARPPTTINQCLNDLIAGYADSNVYMELEKHFMELMEDEYFLQWPLVRYRYASNLLLGYFCGRSEDDFMSGNHELGLKLLTPMAEAGLATAQYDLGRHYISDENTRDLGLKWIIKASKQGYHRANQYLYNSWYEILHSNVSIKAKKEFFAELARIYDGKPLGDLAQEHLSKLKLESEM